MTLRALLLDFGGTLAHERRSRAALYEAAGRDHGVRLGEPRMAVRMAEALGALPRELGGAFRYSDPWFRAYIARVFQGELSAGARLDELSDELLHIFADARTFALFPDVPGLLERLGDLRVGVISNWGPRLAPLLEGLGIEVDLDQCCYDAKVTVQGEERFLNKPTKLLTNLKILSHLRLKCSRNHIHQLAFGRYAKASAKYPLPLCRAWADLVGRAALEGGL